MIGPGDRLWSYSFVEDVAAGHVAALEKGREGERYLLAGDNVDMNGFFAQLAEWRGWPRRACTFPMRRRPRWGSNTMV